MMMGGRLEANVEEDLFKARIVNFFPNSLYNLLIMIYIQSIGPLQAVLPTV